MKEPHLVVISTCFRSPVEEKHKLSVADQTVKASHIFIDAAKQPTPLTHAENLWNASQGLDPDDVIVQLDGDDWLADPYVFDRLTRIYRDPEVWLTYGSFCLNTTMQGVGTNAPYQPGEDVRSSAWWRASHLKTWRAGLFQSLDPSDLKLSDGSFTGWSVDRACMYPMMELAGLDRTRWVRDILMVYNWSNSVEYNNPRATNEKGTAATNWFASKPRKRRLDTYRRTSPIQLVEAP